MKKTSDAIKRLLSEFRALIRLPLTTQEEYDAEIQMSQQFWEQYDREIEEIRKDNAGNE